MALPELPRAYVDTAMPDLTGYVTKTVGVGKDFATLQAALAHPSVKDATTGIILSLTAGETFTGNVTLPVHTNPWVIIQSSAVESLPPLGTRVTPAQSASMPKIVSPNGSSAIAAADAAHHYRLIGLDITVAVGVGTIYSLVALGGNQTVVTQFPHHIIVDRSYVHGQPAGNVYRCFILNGLHLAVINSHVSEAHVAGGDSQAIIGWNGPGPYKIVNNALQGAGENVMFGGADSKSVDFLPSDIEIRRNHLAKPLAWRIDDPSYAGTPWTVKNLLELKVGRRVLIEGNLLEYNWRHAQIGFAVLLTVRNQSGTAPWSVVGDVMFRHNIVRHTGSVFSISGTDDLQPSQRTQRIAILNNLFDDVNGLVWSPGTPGRLFILAHGVEDLTVEHNTALLNPTYDWVIYMTSVADPGAGLVFRYNITHKGAYGITGDAQGTATAGLNYFFPGYVFEKNVIAGANAATYPPGNYYPASLDTVEFVDVASGDYRLAEGSPYRGLALDGADLGVDMDALNAVLGGGTEMPKTLTSDGAEFTNVGGGTYFIRHQLLAADGTTVEAQAVSAAVTVPADPDPVPVAVVPVVTVS